jgi:hypothetical protein
MCAEYRMSRDRRLIVILAGLLSAISASVPRISGALRIPETMLLIAVIIGEALLVARLYVVSRRNGTSKAPRS